MLFTKEILTNLSLKYTLSLLQLVLSFVYFHFYPDFVICSRNVKHAMCLYFLENTNEGLWCCWLVRNKLLEWYDENCLKVLNFMNALINITGEFIFLCQAKCYFDYANCYARKFNLSGSFHLSSGQNKHDHMFMKVYTASIVYADKERITTHMHAGTTCAFLFQIVFHKFFIHWCHSWGGGRVILYKQIHVSVRRFFCSILMIVRILSACMPVCGYIYI